MLDRARSEGVDITADIYPYTYWQANLGVFFPKRKFADRQEATFVLAHVTRPDGIIVNSMRTHPEYTGKTLAEIATLRKVEPVDALLAGVNDGDDEIDAIEQLFKGKYAILNMIPYNSVEGLGYQRPSWERAAEIARTLHRRGVLTKLRQSAGQDVDGGCGQLRAREAVSSRPFPVPVASAP